MLQSMASRSINSIALGTMPCLNTSPTALQASVALLNGINIKRSCLGRGMSLNTILVTMPKVPSLPIIK